MPFDSPGTSTRDLLEDAGRPEKFTSRIATRRESGTTTESPGRIAQECRSIPISGVGLMLQVGLVDTFVSNQGQVAGNPRRGGRKPPDRLLLEDKADYIAIQELKADKPTKTTTDLQRGKKLSVYDLDIAAQRVILKGTVRGAIVPVYGKGPVVGKGFRSGRSSADFIQQGAECSGAGSSLACVVWEPLFEWKTPYINQSNCGRNGG